MSQPAHAPTCTASCLITVQWKRACPMARVGIWPSVTCSGDSGGHNAHLINGLERRGGGLACGSKHTHTHKSNTVQAGPKGGGIKHPICTPCLGCRSAALRCGEAGCKLATPRHTCAGGYAAVSTTQHVLDMTNICEAGREMAGPHFRQQAVHSGWRQHHSLLWAASVQAVLWRGPYGNASAVLHAG